MFLIWKKWDKNWSYFCVLVPNGAGNVEVDEISQEEAFEEKLREAMDLAGQKSAQGIVISK